MKKIKILFFAVSIILFSALGASAEELIIAAAANLAAPIKEFKSAFEAKEKGVNLKIVLASSGKLTTQIENGAPFDVFLSADMNYPQTLQKEGLTANEPKVYAYGLLVLWTQKSLDLSKGIEILKDPTIKKIAVASPKVAPYGRESVNAVKFYQIYPQVNHKFVYGESISQTNDFIVSQAADIGFTSKSTVLDPSLKQKGVWVELDPKSYSPIAQGAVILKQTKELAAAQKFLDFVFSEEGRAIFQKNGYNLP